VDGKTYTYLGKKSSGGVNHAPMLAAGYTDAILLIKRFLFFGGQSEFPR
jgi:hypothetical protein